MKIFFVYIVLLGLLATMCNDSNRKKAVKENGIKINQSNISATANQDSTRFNP